MIVAVMGVTGSGKTTVGSLLAKRLGWEYVDADDFHSPANKDKMHRGIPLTDADRLPWLAAIHDYLARAESQHRNLVLACSALKQSYRELLFRGLDTRLVYLKGSYELIDQRLQQRKGHFADDHILAAQFADLEEPTDAVVVDISAEPQQIVDEICRRLKLSPATT
jgi:gluconokinase